MASAATLFNERGYAETSMSDVLARTGLEKGGLYNHFATKDDLAVAAFEYAADRFERAHRRAQDAATGAPAKLLATVDLFAAQGSDPILPGGCPLLNTSVRSTNVHRRLRNAARRAVRRALDRIEAIVHDGVAAGEFAANTDGAGFAAYAFASLEGAVMLARLFDDDMHLGRVSARLHADVAALCTRRGRAALAFRTH